MKRIKEEKGITLVALIITIVVLLILAAVAIGTVKNSDIIGYAQNAAGGYNQAKTNEAERLLGYEDTINKYVPIQKNNIEERIRIALKEAMFEENYTKYNELLSEGAVMFSQDADYAYYLVDYTGNFYSYTWDMENSEVIIITEGNDYYEEVEQLKLDIITIKETFLGKNIESFEPKKSDGKWTLHSVSGLENDLETIRLYILEDEKQVAFNYKEYRYRFNLNIENLVVTDTELKGKIVSLTQSYN